MTSYWSPHAAYDSTPPAWFQDSNGYVHLQGAATLLMSGNGSDQIGTLPPAARPVQDVYTIVHTFAGTYADLHIGTNGEIRVIGPAAPGNTPGWAGYSSVSLDGISPSPAGHRLRDDRQRPSRDPGRSRTPRPVRAGTYINRSHLSTVVSPRRRPVTGGATSSRHARPETAPAGVSPRRPGGPR